MSETPDLAARLREPLTVDTTNIMSLAPVLRRMLVERAEAAALIDAQKAEIERLRENIEYLTNNKWSEIELALADNEAHDLWMSLHGIKSLDDLLARALAAESALSQRSEGGPFEAVPLHKLEQAFGATREQVKAAIGNLGCLYRQLAVAPANYTALPTNAAEAQLSQRSGQAEKVARAFLEKFSGCVVSHPSSVVMYAWLASALAARDGERERLRKALEEIAEGKGRFSQDRFEHACNTIEDMKYIARAALQPETENEHVR